MSYLNNPPNINETFIIESTELTPTITACTGVYTNQVISCDSNTSILLRPNDLIINKSILPEVDATIDAGTPTFRFREINSVISNLNTLNATGGTITTLDSTTLNLGNLASYDGLSDVSNKFLSGTTNGFVLNSISAITGVDTYVTGFTYSNNIATIKRNQNQDNLSILINTMTGLTVTGVLSAITSNATTSNLNKLNATGGTIITLSSSTLNLGNLASYDGLSDVSGKFLSGTTNGFVLSSISAITGVDTYVTGFTYSPTTNTITLKQNQNELDKTLTISSVSGLTIGTGGLTVDGDGIINGNLTATTISAVTYYNLPISIVNVSNLFSTGLFDTGTNVETITYSNFFGEGAGSSALYASDSNFIGYQAGYEATNANDSNFLGHQAGYGAINSNDSNFIGTHAGSGATNAHNSNFIGNEAGNNAISASDSNFMGHYAGNGATNAYNSNFIGESAGHEAINAHQSNFLGNEAGNAASNADYSNFIGNSAGGSATDAQHSNFMGYQAGYYATDSSYSNFIGYNIGNGFNLGTLGSNNIIIGTNISLPSGTTNSLNIGGVLFGKNTYEIITGDPSIVAQTTGKIGINVVNPSEALDVFGNTIISGDLTANTISATTYYNLPLDVKVTGSSFNNSTYDLTLTRNDGVSLTSNLSILSSDMTVTGGTYDINTGVVTFTNNSGGTFNVTGFTSGMTDTFTTGGTVSDGTAIFTKTNGGTYSVSGFATTFTGGTVNGLTANTISATTYQNLPLDITVTGGTFVSSAGTTTFTNNTGGTFTVIGQAKNLALYAEYTGATTYPSPTATGVRSFAIGDGAKVISADGISIGTQAGGAAGNNNNSVITIGNFAGYNTNNSTLSTFIGSNAGLGGNGSINSVMFGNGAGNGNNYSGGSYTVTAPYSIYIGNNAGKLNTTNFSGSNNIVIGNTVGVASGTTNTLNIGGVIWANGLYSTTTGYTSTNAQSIGRVGINSLPNSSYALTVVGNVSMPNYVYGGVIVSSQVGIDTDISLLYGGVDGIKARRDPSNNKYTNTSGNQNLLTLSVPFYSATGNATYNIINISPEIAQSGGTSGITRGLYINPTLTNAYDFRAIEVVTGRTYLKDVVATSVVISSSTQNILKVIGSGNSSSLPIFSVQGSQGELFSVSDSLTGSLFSVNDISGLPVLEAFSDNTVLMGSYLAPSLNTTVKIVATTGSTNIYSIPTSAYTGAFFDYTINDGTNLRAGNIMGIWSGTTIQYSETSTNDIGNTSGLTFNMIISGSSAILKTSGTTGSWIVKTIVRSI